MLVDDKEALKRQIEDDHPEWREARAMPSPIGHVLKEMVEKRLPVEHYPHDPWWIMRVQPNAYATAEDSLLREGFESYSPTFKVIGPMPLRLIPLKKRHQAWLYKREIRRRRFEGYAFVRRMFGSYDANRLFDLKGCGSIVRNAGSVAIVQDYDIEVMRLAEADGSWDETTVETYRGYKVNRINDAATAYTGQSRIVGRLDSVDRTVLFVERMGRIARLIAQADPG